MEFDKAKFIAWAKNYSDYDRLSQKALNAFSGWSVNDASTIFTKSREIIDVLEEVVFIVEKFSKDIDKLSSKEKLDSAVDFLDELIKVPKFFEWADDIVIRYIMTTIVNQKNKWFGKNWFKIEQK